MGENVTLAGSPARRPEGTIATFCLALVLTLALLAAGCAEIADQSQTYDQKTVAGADAERGRRLVESGQYGCPACHHIGPMRKARGIVGPALDNFANRAFIAGVGPNRPGVLIAFLLNPPAVAPGTAMPVSGLDPDEARDIAAYLYTLRGGET